MSRVRISLARAAVSYSSRHRVFSRRPTSSRHRAAIWSGVSAPTVVAGDLGSGPAGGGVGDQPTPGPPPAQGGAQRGEVPGAGGRGQRREGGGERHLQHRRPGGVFNAATEAQVGPSASRIPKMVRLWRYLTAVPADHAPARSCAMRNASTACAYVGAGPSEPCPGGRLGGGLIVATAPSRRLSQKTRMGGASQTTPTAQVSGGAERGCRRECGIPRDEVTTPRCRGGSPTLR